MQAWRRLARACQAATGDGSGAGAPSSGPWPGCGTSLAAAGCAIGAWRVALPVGRQKNRQTVGEPCAVALAAGRAVFPGGDHLAAYARSLRINRAARVTADIGIEGDTAHRRGPSALHDQPMPVERGREFHGHAGPIGLRLGLQPVKGHTKIRTAGATAQTGMHGGYEAAWRQSIPDDSCAKFGGRPVPGR